MVEFLLSMVFLAAVYGIYAVSLNLQVGVTGMLNFGQVAFVGIGAYSVAILDSRGVHWSIGFLVGATLAGLAGALVGRLGRNLTSDYWAIATLALAEIVRLVILNQDSLTGGPQGLARITGLWTNLPVKMRMGASLATVLILLLLTYLVATAIRNSQFGRLLLLVRENPDLAASLRHDVVSTKSRLMALAAVMAAVGGGFYTMYISFIGPTQLLPFATFLIFSMIVVGGLGNTLGAIVGAVLVTTLYDASRFLGNVLTLSADQVAGIRIFLVGAVLLGFLMVRTQGLLPERVRQIDARR